MSLRVLWSVTRRQNAYDMHLNLVCNKPGCLHSLQVLLTSDVQIKWPTQHKYKEYHGIGIEWMLYFNLCVFM